MQSQHKESHQIIDVVAMYRPITKWATSIQHPDNIPEVVRKAVRVCPHRKARGRAHRVAGRHRRRRRRTASRSPPRRFRRPRPDDTRIGQAFELLHSARRPVIIAGNGTIRRRASSELRRFCERTGIGVISTFMAKGCVDMDADYCLFTIGLQQRDELSHLVAESDLIITVGYDMAEYPPRLWNCDREKPNIHIDFTPAEIDAHYHPSVELIGDIAACARAVDRARSSATACRRIDLGRQRETRQVAAGRFRRSQRR